MNTYRVVKLSTAWSTSRLTEDVEALLEDEERAGWSVVSVAFGVNLWWMPTAFITLRRKESRGYHE